MNDIFFSLYLDGLKWKFQFASNRFFDATGLLPRNVIGKSIEDVIPKENYPLVSEKIREAISTHQVVSWQGTGIYPTGIKHSHITIVTLASDDTVIGWIHDMTECIERMAKALGYTEWLQWYKKHQDKPRNTGE